MTDLEKKEVLKRRLEYKTNRQFRILKRLMLEQALYFMRHGQKGDQLDLIKRILPNFMPKIIQGGGEESDPISIIIKTKK